MQQAPQNPTSVPQVTMIELFSRFLNRLLEKEEKYPIFLEEWEKFKTIISKPSINMDTAFIHLATMQLNIEQKVQAAPKANGYNIKIEKSLDPIATQKVERRPSSSFNLGPDTKSLYPSFITLAEDHSISTEAMSSARLPTSTTASQELKKMTSNESTGSFRFFESPDSPKTHYPLSFLAQRAREFNKRCVNNTEQLMSQLEKRRTNTYHAAEMADRTPLRRIAVYSKQGNDQPQQTDQHNLLYNALQNLAVQFQRSPANHPFNKDLITH